MQAVALVAGGADRGPVLPHVAHVAVAGAVELVAVPIDQAGSTRDAAAVAGCAVEPLVACADRGRVLPHVAHAAVAGAVEPLVAAPIAAGCCLTSPTRPSLVLSSPWSPWCKRSPWSPAVPSRGPVLPHVAHVAHVAVGGAVGWWPCRSTRPHAHAAGSPSLVLSSPWSPAVPSRPGPGAASRRPRGRRRCFRAGGRADRPGPPPTRPHAHAAVAGR